MKLLKTSKIREGNLSSFLPPWRAIILAAAAAGATMLQAEVDIENYYFRYDFSSGAKVFYGSDAVKTDPLKDKKSAADMIAVGVFGPDGANTAVHPMKDPNADYDPWSTIGSNQAFTLFNNDWTCAMSVRPGATENGVIFSIGRKNTASRKNISICASSDPARLIIDQNKNVSGTQSLHSQIVLDNNVDVSKGFHTVVAVYKKPVSGNAGMLDFYVDGVYQKSLTTLDYEFGGAFAFCTTISGLTSGEVGTSDDFDVAFRDLRFYSSAFTSTDARRYAALYPAADSGKLRECAYVRAYGANAVDTGYSVTPQTRIGIDCQFTEVVNAARMFGAGEYDHESLGCAFYIQSQGNFAHIFNDGYDYTESSLGNKNTATTRRVKAVLDRPVGYSYLWKDGAKTTDNQTGNATLESAITLPLFAEKSTTVTQNFSKAMIYSLDIQEDESLVHFFAPHYDETLGACFKDIVTGEMKGESMESPTTALTYNDGFGSSADYRYENGTLYAKVYIDSADAQKGTVAVSAGGATLTPEADGGYWVAYNMTLTLAATPESGYAFAGWAGDVNAIQSGTTASAAMTILIDRATQFEARFAPAPDAEIFHTRAVGPFAKRAQDFDTGDYVQTGLVLHYDGKRNVGTDAAHDPDATMWKNLGSLGSANDATLKTLGSNIPSGANAGSWGADGYNFGGKNYFAIPAATLGGAVTVQIAADYDNSKQLVVYPAFFGQTSSNNDNFMVYFNRNWGNDTDNCKLRFKMFNEGQHGAKSVWSGPFATAIYDTACDASEGVSVGNGDVPDWQTRNVSGSNPSYTYAIGATKNTDRNRKDRMLVGTVKSIRVYTQVLDDEALIWNRFVDDVRYNDGSVDVDLVVTEDVQGREGVEGAGEYMVNGSHTFTATNLTDGVFAWSPAGYALEKWDGSKWVFDSYGQGSSYAYTNCTANGRMRLTWIWKQTGRVRKYDAGDYIQYNIPSTFLAHFDGIKNAGANAAHEISPVEWVNLAGGFNLATNKAPAFSQDAWVADRASYFTSASDDVKNALAAKSFTLEMMISNPGGQAKDSYEYWAYFGNGSKNRQLVVDLREPNSKNPLVQGVQYRESGWNDRSKVTAGSTTEWNKRQYVAVVCDSAAATTYCDGANQIHRNTGGTLSPSQTGISFGASFDGAWPLYAGSEICAIRMTAGALESWQLEYNNAIDQVRFNGNVTIVNGAVGETGEVGSSSATDGVYDVASGTWTVTAADVRAGGRTYKPHLTVETLTDGKWVRTAKLWTDSYTVDKSALDGNRIKLTWTWAIPPGFIITIK